MRRKLAKHQIMTLWKTFTTSPFDLSKRNTEGENPQVTCESIIFFQMFDMFVLCEDKYHSMDSSVRTTPRTGERKPRKHSVRSLEQALLRFSNMALMPRGIFSRRPSNVSTINNVSFTEISTNIVGLKTGCDILARCRLG